MIKFSSETDTKRYRILYFSVYGDNKDDIVKLFGRRAIQLFSNSIFNHVAEVFKGSDGVEYIFEMLLGKDYLITPLDEKIRELKENKGLKIRIEEISYSITDEEYNICLDDAFSFKANYSFLLALLSAFDQYLPFYVKIVPYINKVRKFLGKKDLYFCDSSVTRNQLFTIKGREMFKNIVDPLLLTPQESYEINRKNDISEHRIVFEKFGDGEESIFENF